MDAIFITDPHGNFLTVNARTCAMFGYTRTELVQMNVCDFLLPKDLVDTPLRVEELRAGNSIVRTERRVRRRDGTLLYVESRGQLLEQDRFQFIVRDITDQKCAEVALRDSEERYASIFEHALDNIFVIRVLEGGTFVYESFNPAQEAITGLSSSIVQGKTPEQCLPADFAIHVTERYQACVDAGHSISYDEEAHLPVGIRSAHTILVPIRDATGHIFRLVGISRDITDRKVTEEKIRTALREKEVLLKEIHHRVKNNLQVISRLLNLQTTTLKDPQLLSVFRESQLRVRAIALLHEKLYQSHDLAKVDFPEYICSLVNYLLRAYAATRSGVALQMQLENVFLRVDTAMPCGLILNEVITNALKHAFPDGRDGTLHISLSVDHREQVHLQVKDDGVGFPRGFDFRQANSLGLQLVSTLIEQLQGTIKFEGDTGTTVLLTFPQ